MGHNPSQSPTWFRLVVAAIARPAAFGMKLRAYRDAMNSNRRPEAARAFCVRELMAAAIEALLEATAKHRRCGERVSGALYGFEVKRRVG